ncbi:MAG: TolC family protein [Nannocystaceae bacterium]
MSPWTLPFVVLGLAGQPAAATLPETAAPEAVVFDTGPVETMTLAEAEAALVAANPDLASASAAIDDAQAVVLQSFVAIKPMVSMSTSYTRNNADASLDLSQALAGLAQSLEQATMMPVDLGDTGGETVIQPLQSLSATGQISVPVFAASAYADIKAARASARSAAASRDATLARLHGGLHQTAWLAAAAQALVEVSEHAVDNAADHVRRTKRMVELGTTTQLSLDQAQLQWLGRRSDLLTARAELARMQLSIGVMLGRPAAIRIVLPDSPPPDELAPSEQMVGEALAGRPELVALQADERAARFRLRSAKMAYAPTLSATFSASTSTAPYVTGLYYSWQAGLSLKWTLYAGGSRKGSRRRAEAALRRAAAQTRKRELEVRQEVLDAQRELRLAQARVRLAEQESAVANRAAQSAGQNFELGRATSTEVVDALDSAFQAEIQREEARARAAAAQSQLRTARGSM